MEAIGSQLILYGSPETEIELWSLADLHLGNIGCAKDRLQADIDRIAANPNAFWIMPGDYCDFIAPDDKRFDFECVDEDLKVRDMGNLAACLLDKLEKLLDPIKARCLAAGYGNHEWKYMRGKAATEIHDSLCTRLGVRNLRWSGFMDLYFEPREGLERTALIRNPGADALGRPGQRRLRIFVDHGSGASATAGGKAQARARIANRVEGVHLILSAHLHEQNATPFVRLTPNKDCTQVTERVAMLLATGSYLRGFMPGCTSYAEQRGYAPTTLGATLARFRPATGRLVPENAAENIGDVF